MSKNNQEKEKSDLDKQIERRIKLSELYFMLEGKGLVSKSATLQDQRITYIRGRDLLKIFNDNRLEITKTVIEIVGHDLGKGENAITNLYHL